MSIPKWRAAIVVFLVGFALGLSVFAASRLFVLSVLNGDAIATAEELAGDIVRGEPVATSAALSSVISYTYFDLQGDVIETASLGDSGYADLSAAERGGLTSLAAKGGAVIEDVSLLVSLIGPAASAIKRVAVPVVSDGTMIGTLLVEVDQARTLLALTRAFSVVAIVTIGLAVLAVIAVAFVVTRGYGFREQKVFDPTAVAHDPLTGVPTRAGFQDILDDAVERAAENDRQVLVMIADLDRFRSVNTIWGQAVGDAVLKIAAERLRALATAPTGIGRVSSDAFAIIVEGDTVQSAQAVADRIRDAIAEPFEVDGASVMLSVTLGAALYPINAENGEVLLRAAAGALSKAKAEGRNALAVFDTEMKERMQRNEALERDLRNALERQEFVVFYQPQLELASGKLRGYEALVRWERPKEGILAPRDFLNVAEETGLIRPIGDWVLRKACADAASWLDDSLVAVNISPAQLCTRDFDKTIAEVLEETKLPPQRLEIEIPESLFLDRAPEVLQALNRIKALGVRVAMDDFGAGYLGLTSLTHFPFDKVKIDRSFVAKLTEDTGVAAIVASIATLGRTLSVDVTAEGVETSDQVTLLKAAGCKIVQGFMFGAPRRAWEQRAAEDDGEAEVSAEPNAAASEVG